MTDRRQLTPNVDYLRECGRYMIDTEDMAGFLQIPAEALKHMVWMGRLPLPLKLGFGQTTRWNVVELLTWVVAGCPRSAEWIRMRDRKL
jgi:hypothetical protein